MWFVMGKATRRRGGHGIGVVYVALCVTSAGPALGAAVELAWSPVAAAAGYKVYVSQTSGAYQLRNAEDLGLPTSVADGIIRHEVDCGLVVGVVNYFVITSYSVSNVESAFSNELSLLISAIPTSTRPLTATPTFPPTRSPTAPATSTATPTERPATATATASCSPSQTPVPSATASSSPAASAPTATPTSTNVPPASPPETPAPVTPDDTPAETPAPSTGPTFPELVAPSTMTASPLDTPTPTPTVASTVTPTERATPTASSTQPETPLTPCVGDCDQSGAVTVDSLAKGAAIVLGRLGVDDCPWFDLNGDGQVTIDELERAIDNALNGCPESGATKGLARRHHTTGRPTRDPHRP